MSVPSFTRSDAWKNFDLGQELAISGAFIYNGLRTFHDMEALDNADEAFELLYHLAVGFERLLKVAVVLLEHDATKNQATFEASLVTHNHLDLIHRVRGHRALVLGPSHHRFLQLLATFYKSHRYDRYSLNSEWEPDKECKALRKLLEANLNTAIEAADSSLKQNNPRFRRHIGKVACTIARALFGVVRDRASELNLYTYELRHGSKARKIFLGRDCTFEDEDVLWKELLIFLMNTTETSALLEYMRSIDPLPLDKGLVPDYLQCFRSYKSRAAVREELEELYSELSNPGQRLDRLAPLGEPGYFQFEDDYEDPLDSEI